MYCERCGKQIDESLNYCNACGSQLRREIVAPQKSLTAFMISALACTLIFGLIILAMLMSTLFEKVPNPAPIVVFGVAYLVVLFGICFIITRQVSKLIDADLRSRDLAPRASAPPLVQLPPRSTSQLEEFREPASVTDHTTRTLEASRVRES
jgi:hypothetical protein